ncbi:MAG TPA: hybrid sensor histidine kinase/response regulator [Methanomicrobiales archaeon]|nr:hybrid sensor histidine kinase/response regulator [Methanomicrobiales archaeon]
MREKMRILLIEDDPGFVRLIREMFKEASGTSFLLQHADRLSDGLSILESDNIDVVLLDLMLPDSAHLDTVRRVVEHSPNVPIVVLTTLHDEQTGLEAIQAGAQDYLFKGEVESALLSRALRYAVERKQTERALKQMNRNLSLMNSITRHDILNQLTVILGYLPMIQEMASDPKQAEYLDRLEKAALTIKRHIEFTRDYQSIGAQSPLWQNLRTTVFDALADIDTRNVALSVDLKDIEVYADPMLEKVFYNLVDNSLRHGGKVDAIHLYNQEDEDGIQIIYEDNGIGIPPEEKEKIFRRSKGGDHGFGLFLIRNILAITNLEIHETGEPGKGVRFVIQVPRGLYRMARE